MPDTQEGSIITQALTVLEGRLAAQRATIERFQERERIAALRATAVALPAAQPTWTTSKGTTVYVTEMNTGHLLNTITKLERQGFGVAGVIVAMRAEVARRVAASALEPAQCKAGIAACTCLIDGIEKLPDGTESPYQSPSAVRLRAKLRADRA